MKLLPAFIAITVFTINAPAVDIRLCPSGICGANFAQCSNVPNHTCCILALSQTFNSSLFRNLPTLGIGAICHRYLNNSCAVFRALGLGTNLCLPLLNASGAYWVGHPNSGNGNGNSNDEHGARPSVSSLQMVQDSGAPTDEVMADIVAIDDHRFSIGEKTPFEVTRGLIRHLIAESRYDDLPEEYKAYELATLASDEG